MTGLPLSPAEQEAVQDGWRKYLDAKPGYAASAPPDFNAGWLAARDYYAEQSEAFAAGQKMEWDAMNQRAETAEQERDAAQGYEPWDGEKNAIYLFHRERKARALAEQRERALRIALLAAREDILRVARGIDAALAAHPETEPSDRDRAAAG